MKRLIGATLTAFGCVVFGCNAGGVTLDPDAFHRFNLLTVAGRVDGTLRDFPLLVRIDKDHVTGWESAASADGSDIRFADAQGNLLPHEIDTWETDGEGLGRGLVWVKVPELTTGTSIWMYWSPKSLPLPEVDPTDVWTEYLGVWHCGDAGETIRDSTANHLDLQLTSGSVLAADDARVGGATKTGENTKFTSAQALVAGSAANHGTNCTFSGYYKHTGSTTPSYWPALISTKADYNTVNGGFCAFFRSTHEMNFTGGGYDESDIATKYTVPDVSEWYAFSFPVNGRDVGIYSKGELLRDVTISSSVTDSTEQMYIGYDKYGPGNSYYDELRIRKVASSPAWIRAEYDSLADENFVLSGVGVLTRYEPGAFRRQVKATFRGYEEETLVNFPALVRISPLTIAGFSMSQLGAKVNGARRICFTDENGAVLPYDVDTWDEDGELLVWVKVPALRPGAFVTVRWGLDESALVDPKDVPSASDVWTEYLGVWHFGEGRGTIRDSTANRLDLQLTSGTAFGAAGACVGGATGAEPNTEFASTLALADAAVNHGAQCTFSGFFKHTGSATSYGPALIRTKREYNTGDGGFCSFLQGLDKVAFTGGGSTAWNQTTLGIPSVADWLAFSFVADNSDVGVYNKGVDLGTVRTTSPVTDATTKIFVGYTLYNPGNGYYDEFRIRKVKSSSMWVKAEYETVSDEGFVAFGEMRNYDAGLFLHKVKAVLKGYEEEELTNFPVLVKMSSKTIDGFSPSQLGPKVNGTSRIGFTDENGAILPYDVDCWDESDDGELLVWVKVPVLRPGAAIWIHWGLDALPRVDPRTVPLSTDVWTEYLGVWHCGDAGLVIKDSTANHLDLRLASGSVLAADDARVGGATKTGAHTKFTSAQALVAGSATNHGSNCTFSGYYKHAGGTSGFYPALISTKADYNTKTGGFCAFFRSTSQMSFTGGSDEDISQKHDIPDVANWFAFSFALNVQDVGIYSKGELLKNVTMASPVTDSTERMYIGYHQYAPGNCYYDELRIRKTTSSSTWIKAEYETVDASDFMTYGKIAQKRYATKLFANKAKIVFRGSQDEVLTNFPALVRISAKAIAGFSMSDLGPGGNGTGRICFTDENGTILPYEVDNLNEGDGELLAWVKVPVLRPRTAIWFYWGLDTATIIDPRTVPSPTDIWTGYLGVWHFGDASEVIKDSTANHLDLQLTDGTMAEVANACVGGATAAGANTEFASILALADAADNHGAQCTFSGFFKHTGGGNGYWPALIRTKREYNTEDGGFCSFLQGLDKVAFTGGGSTEWDQYTLGIPSVADWLAFSFVADNSDVRVYNKGVFLETVRTTSPVADATTKIFVGYTKYNPGDSYYDEFRIRKATSSAAWVKAEYETACDPSFASYGAARKNSQGLIFLIK